MMRSPMTYTTSQPTYQSSTVSSNARYPATTYATHSPTYGGYSSSSATRTGGASVQYTSDASQRYIPAGCQPVHAFPHGISTVYSTGLVPAFMAPPEIRVSSSSLLNLN
eukprot:Blabericola_migrator_1__12267@NODE_765_length_6607_cov_284_868043_g545_i0_p6_GENE_NODE_765_length_6607_cov_284_868043_g545_i0NODE_765_length_6607_cov_284_868043_g545_i0_p6_ORF_typecomplete_len109_score5_77_NODE_765_length_6607_cov_284_868043_g545_i062366562